MIPVISKINITPMVEEKPVPVHEEPLVYANKTVSLTLLTGSVQVRFSIMDTLLGCRLWCNKHIMAAMG